MKVTKRQLRRIIREEVVEGKLQDQVEELVRDLDTEEYEVFAFDNDIDPEDANQMMDFIAQLSNKDAKDIIKQLSESVVNEAKFNKEIGKKPNMKITKRQLRRIIREERARLSEMKLMDPAVREQLATQGGDEALREIQNAMGITDGGVAGQWPGFGRLVDLLIDYINFEESNR